MGFNLYQYQLLENQKESYVQPERLVFSGAHGPLAIYVQSVYKNSGHAEWELSEMELAALVRPGKDISGAVVLFETGNQRPGTITIHRVVSIHGRSTPSETEIVVHFKSLLSNFPIKDADVFRKSFEVPVVADHSDIYENLKLSGGISGGTWKWMESEQILTASVIAPTHATR